MCVLRFLLLVVAGLQHGLRNYAEAHPDSDPVLSNLRSQLMANNYDYEQSDSLEKALRMGSQDSSTRSDRAGGVNDNSELSDFTVDRNVLNGYISDMSDMNKIPIDRGQNEELADEGGAGDPMHDKQWERGVLGGLPVSPYLAGGRTTAALPYKVLTGRGQSARRNNPVLRFLQAELNDTVLVAPLLPGPPPVFQLPSGRRQYREVSGEDDLELDDDLVSAKEDEGAPQRR